MSVKEARARIKINKLLKEAGWRFFDDESGPANIVLESHVKITQTQISELGENFEETKSSFIDFLLLDEKGFPFVVLEAKAKQALVEGNRELVTRFEAKIQQTSARVWGEKK